MGRQDQGVNSTNRRKKLSTQKGLAVAKTNVILIVDGNTESEYFKRINELGIFSNCRIKTIKGNDSNYSIINKENLDNEHVYLILDIDNCLHDNEVRVKRIKKILKTKKHVYYNNYSFETFLINHIILFGKPITDKTQYDSHMKTHFCVEGWSGTKNDRNTKKVISKINEENIKLMKVNVNQIHKENCFDNPNSNMHLLFEKIENIK